MAYLPVSNLLTQYDSAEFANYYLKFYLAGTTTPLSMATDAAAGTLLVKCPLDTSGFFITGLLGPRFIPYVNSDYDAWLFPTEAEADANDTTNATQIADNISFNTEVEWISQEVATYVNATTFTLVGNQTAIYKPGRRGYSTGGADRFWTIDTSAFTTLTTVTVKNIIDDSSPPVVSTLHTSMDTAYVDIKSPRERALTDSSPFNAFDYDKNRIIDAGIDFNVLADGSDETSKLQAAIAKASTGTIIELPYGDITFTTLTTDKSIIIRGKGENVRANNPFGNAAWDSKSINLGTILRSTTTSGTALSLTGSSTVWQYGLQNLALIGPGSGTSKGVEIGTAALAVAPCTLRDVMIANFATGLEIENVFELDALNAKVRGCTTGLSIPSLSSDLHFYRSEFQTCVDGILLTACSNVFFDGCLLQNNTNMGLKIAPSVAGAIDNIVFKDGWSENNPTGGGFLELDTTAGSGRLLTVQNTKIGSDVITFTGTGTFTNLIFESNQGLGITLTVPSHITDFTSLNNAFIAIVDNSTTSAGIQNIVHGLQTTSAWCQFDGTLTGANAPTDGFNVTTVTRNSTGNYTITFTNALPAATYAVAATGQGFGVTIGPIIDIYGQGTGSFNMQTFSHSTGAVYDCPKASVIVQLT